MILVKNWEKWLIRELPMQMDLKNRGFTLIELMIVIILMVILVALAAPSFKSVLDGRRLVGATDALYSALQFARSEAIKQNKSVQFEFNTATWCFGIDDSGADCNCNVPSTCTINGAVKVFSVSDYKNISLTSASFAGSTITFEPRQGLVSDDGTFTLSTGTRTKQVEVNIVGRVRVE